MRMKQKITRGYFHQQALLAWWLSFRSAKKMSPINFDDLIYIIHSKDKGLYKSVLSSFMYFDAGLNFLIVHGFSKQSVYENWINCLVASALHLRAQYSADISNYEQALVSDKPIEKFFCNDKIALRIAELAPDAAVPFSILLNERLRVEKYTEDPALSYLRGMSYEQALPMVRNAIRLCENTLASIKHLAVADSKDIINEVMNSLTLAYKTDFKAILKQRNLKGLIS